MSKIRKGDDVVVLSGRDKGKRGTVLQIIENNRILVDNVNVIKKHVKPNPNRGETGGIIEKEAPIQISNVALFNPNTNKADRVGYKLLEDGRKGRKSDKGFYLYEKGKKGAVDESVYGILGVTPGTSDATDEELQDRLVLQMVNAAALCLQEGILRSARDGDVGAIFGLGFPPYTGGPFTYIDNVGADKIVERLDGFAARFGERFTAAQILRDYAREGKKFRD